MGVQAVEALHILCYHDLCVHCVSTEMADDRGWLLAAGQVILFTLLFSITAMVNTIWWTATCGTMIFTTHTHSNTSIHTPLTQTFLSSIFHAFSSQAPDQLAKPLLTVHEYAYI